MKTNAATLPMKADGEGKILLLGLLICSLVLGGIYLWGREISETGKEIKRVAFEEFWDGGGWVTNWGGLTTKELLSMRAFARRKRVPVRPHAASAGVIGSAPGYMEPLTPYYVYDYDNKTRSVLVSQRPVRSTDDAARGGAVWVAERDVFCWVSQHTLNIEEPTAIYASLEDARQGTDALEDLYQFSYAAHFQGRDGENTENAEDTPMAALPVLRRERENGLWEVMLPESGSRSQGDDAYAMRWVRWDGRSAALTCRLRITRVELESYLQEMHRLLRDFRESSLAEQNQRKVDIVRASQQAMTQEDMSLLDGFGLNELATRTQGLAMASELLARPITSPMQYENVNEKFQRLLRVSTDPTIWDRLDVAYIPIEEML